MTDTIPADWRVALATAIAAPSFAHVTQFVATERARTDTAIYPPVGKVFAALRLTPLASVRAVILGQDPYHGPHEAEGLSFSVPAGVKLPPSLRNVIKEWESDLGLPLPAEGSLQPWARHGVLLLNTVLTVRRDEPNSHKGQGWEPFTDAIVRAVVARPEPVAFLLWGRQAQKTARLVTPPHFVLEAAHPSPFSAKRFFGSRPFSGANTGLADRGRPGIDWSLATDPHA
jgi:uracil-DNA glycosylase